MTHMARMIIFAVLFIRVKVEIQKRIDYVNTIKHLI